MHFVKKNFLLFLLFPETKIVTVLYSRRLKHKGIAEVRTEMRSYQLFRRDSDVLVAHSYIHCTEATTIDFTEVDVM